MEAEALNPCVRGKRTCDARDPSGTVMDKFGWLIVIANFKMLVHINRGLGLGRKRTESGEKSRKQYRPTVFPGLNKQFKNVWFAA